MTDLLSSARLLQIGVGSHSHETWQLWYLFSQIRAGQEQILAEIAELRAELLGQAAAEEKAA